jgi:uncharacterized membrane protein YqhA
MIRRLLAASRFFIAIAILGAFLAAIAVTLNGLATVIAVIIAHVQHLSFTFETSKTLAVECIELIDQFLLGVVLFIIALGLYDLFIDDRLPMPHWLEIHTLDDLKQKLVDVVAVLLVVSFLGYVVEWDGNSSILFLGLAIGAVLLPIGLFFRHDARRDVSALTGGSDKKEDP